MKTVTGLIIGFVIGLIILPVLAVLYIRLGYAPVATAAPALPFERWAAKTALHARITAEAPKQVPVAATEANLTAGAKVYRNNCMLCHGLPDQPITPVAKGMYPHPPQLFHGKGVTDDPVGVTFWKVDNGIRLTGMPAFTGSLTKEQIWQVSQLLANGNHLPAAARAILQAPLQ